MELSGKPRRPKSWVERLKRLFPSRSRSVADPWIDRREGVGRFLQRIYTHDSWHFYGVERTGGMLPRKIINLKPQMTHCRQYSVEIWSIFLFGTLNGGGGEAALADCAPSGSATGNKNIFFGFEIITNLLVRSSRFIRIPLLWVYDRFKRNYSYSAGIDFRRPNPTSTDVRFRRLKSIPVL